MTFVPEKPSPILGRTELWLAPLLLVAYGWLFVFFPKINNPNELVRVYETRAIVEQHSYAIGRRVQAGGRFADTGPLFAEWGWINDRSLVCDNPSLKGPYCAGALYSGKAPGMSLVAVPALWAQDVLTRAIANRMPSKDEYVFVLRWLFAILPSVAMWLVLRRFLIARGVDAPLALAATLAGACGSLSFTFGQMFAGHQATGIAMAFAFFAVFWPERKSSETSRALLIGFALSAAVCLEYQSAPAAILIGLAWLWVRFASLEKSTRVKAAAALVAGALPFVLLLAQFHTAVYGAPWKTGYSFLENAGFQKDIAPGFLGISLPTGERIWGSFFSSALGLFFFAPWTALTLGALPLAWKKWKRDATLESRAAHLVLPAALAVVLYYFAFQSGHALWRSGWTVGPRYITPLCPFAAIAVALALQSLDVNARTLGAALLGGSGAAAILATGLASFVCQGFPDEPLGPLAEIVIPLYAHGFVARNPLQALGVPGLWSALPALASLTIAAIICMQTTWRLDADRKLRQRALAFAIGLFALLSLGQWTAHAHPGPYGSAAFLASQWSPPHPPGSIPF